MVARIVRQDEAIREDFRKRILAKVQAEKDSMKERIDDIVPSFLAWAVKPLAGLAFDMQRNKDNNKGEGGELNVGIHLRLVLSKEWILMNDVVVEPEPEVFAQTDHIAIGPAGVFVIETKAWDGAFTGYKDRWKRKEGNKWISCHSPTQQNLRHVKLIRKWLEQTGMFNLSFPAEEWIKPIVVFTRAAWLKTTDCSMPVLDGALDLAFYLRKQKEVCLNAEQIEKISLLLAYPQLRNSQLAQQETATSGENQVTDVKKDEQNNITIEKISSAEALVIGKDKNNANIEKTKVKVETGRTKNGRDFVRVYGNKVDAEVVRQKYISEGQESGPVNRDKYRQGVWYFYLSK